MWWLRISRPARWSVSGSDIAQLSASNPKIILCSISGFGQSGPMASAPAYDIVAQALGGTMSITGNPGGEPLRCGVSIGDLSGALYGIIGILSALRTRDATARASTSISRCSIARSRCSRTRSRASRSPGKMPGPLGTRHPSITPFQQFRATDGFFVEGAGNEAIWQRMCDAIGMPELKDDPRFLRNADRTAHHAELEKILAQHFATRTRAILAGEARRRLGSVRADRQCRGGHAQLASDGAIDDSPRRPSEFDDLIVPGSPLKSAGDKDIPSTRSPRLGENTDEVLSSVLGYDTLRLSELRKRSII